MKKGEPLMVSLLAIITFGFLFESFQLSPTARLLPLPIAATTLSFCVMEIIRIIREAGSTNRDELPNTDLNRREGRFLVWLGGLVLAAYLVGFLIAAPVFVSTYVWRFSALSARASVVLGAVTLLTLYLLLIVGLDGVFDSGALGHLLDL